MSVVTIFWQGLETTFPSQPAGEHPVASQAVRVATPPRGVRPLVRDAPSLAAHLIASLAPPTTTTRTLRWDTAEPVDPVGFGRAVAVVAAAAAAPDPAATSSPVAAHTPTGGFFRSPSQRARVHPMSGDLIDGCRLHTQWAPPKPGAVLPGCHGGWADCSFSSPRPAYPQDAPSCAVALRRTGTLPPRETLRETTFDAEAASPPRVAEVVVSLAPEPFAVALPPPLPPPPPAAPVFAGEAEPLVRMLFVEPTTAGFGFQFGVCERGAVVTSVESHGAAAQAGLCVDHVILRINSTTLRGLSKMAVGVSATAMLGPRW